MASVLWLAPVRNAADGLDCEPKPLPWIPPGTEIGDAAPAGWTTLIFKTQPRLDGGDVEELSDLAAALADLFFTALVARVETAPALGGRDYRLDEVAIGLGTKVDGRDMIVSRQTQAELGARFDLLQQAVLIVSEHQLARAMQIARCETMVLVDLPTVMLRKGKHRNVVLRHAVVVDPKTGRLQNVVWLIDVAADGSYRLAADVPAVLTPPDLHQTILLHVDGSDLVAGFPTSPMAFAATEMPHGVEVTLPEALRQIAGSPRLTAATVRTLEAGLVGMLDAEADHD